jgi:hypothetical protein
MFASDTILGIRNILLIQLLLIVTSPAQAIQVRRELLKIWKRNNTSVLPKENALSNKKKGSFWEIDLTRFEP